MAAQELVESFVGLGETIPFDNDEREADSDADAAEQELQPERPAGAENQLGDADGDTEQIDIATAPNEFAALLDREWWLEATTFDVDFGPDAERGDRDADKKRQIADDGFLRQQVKSQGADEQDIAGVFDGLDDLWDAPPARFSVIGVGPAPGADAVEGITELPGHEDPDRPVGGCGYYDHN